jgi:hypothetical protein
MDFNTGKPNHIEDVLLQMHESQWFGWKDSKNKTYANLIVHDGYTKPTKASLEKILVDRQEAVSWKQVRAKRDILLNASDYVLMPDYPMADKSEWESYRQNLRDVPQQDVLPDAVIWPEKPEEDGSV